MSMRRFDDALAVYTEYRKSGEETWSVDTRMDMAKCYRQKGEIDSARHILEGLADTSTASYRPYILTDLALLRAIGAQYLTTALKLAEKAQAELNSPDDWVIEPLLRLQYASGKMDDAAKSLEQLGGWWRWGKSSHPYRKAQLAAVTGLSGASQYLDDAISSLTRLTRGEWMDADLGDASAFLALALARAKKRDEARQELKRALKLEPEREDIAYHAACAYSLIGDTVLALQWLETAIKRGYQELWWARVDPDLDPLRKLPRFQEIMNDWDTRLRKLFD
jgi:tetratricopeptide (TPR) repeat protein